MTNTASDPCAFTVPDGVIWREVDREVLIMDTRSGRVFGLEPVGGRMWELLQRHSFEGIVAAIVAEFEVEEERARRDLDLLCMQMLAHGLLVPR